MKFIKKLILSLFYQNLKDFQKPPSQQSILEKAKNDQKRINELFKKGNGEFTVNGITFVDERNKTFH